jgi:hypothetical protein
MMLSLQEYMCLLRRDLLSFIERSFYEINPLSWTPKTRQLVKVEPCP